MTRIPLHNLFEDALKIRDIDNPGNLDKLIAELEAEIEEEKLASPPEAKKIKEEENK